MTLMSQMRRFSISARMRGAIVAVLGLVLLVGGLGLGGMLRLDQLADDFYDTSYSEVRTLSQLDASLLKMRVHERDMILGFEKAELVEKHLALWKRDRDAASALIQRMLQSHAQQEAVDVLRQTARLLDDYTAVIVPVGKQLAEAGFDNASGADRVLRRAHEAFGKVQGDIAALHAIIDANAARAREASSRAKTVTMVLFAAAVALVAAIVVPTTLLNARSITAPLRHAGDVARDIASGDLTQPIHAEGGDEAAQLLRSLQSMQDALRRMVGEVRGSTSSIGTASSEIAWGSQDLSHRTEQAASNLQQAASSMEQLTGTVRQSAESARQANELAAQAAEVAVRGGAVVSDVVRTMQEINASSRKIADITGVIDGIAFQTNILALNAAVEAARAGQQGLGFAVVAGEVRGLAGRSADAAREIKALINASVQKVEGGTRLVADAGTTMAEVVGAVQRVRGIVGEISLAAMEQSQGIEQVNTSVVHLDRVTQQNAALVEESAAAAESMKEQAQRLAGLVANFKLETQAEDLAGADPLGNLPSFPALH